MWDNLNCCTLLVTVKRYAVKNSLTVFHKEIFFPLDPAREIKIHVLKKGNRRMLIPALLKIANNNWKPPMCPTEGQMNCGVFVRWTAIYKKGINYCTCNNMNESQKYTEKNFIKSVHCTLAGVAQWIPAN